MLICCKKMKKSEFPCRMFYKIKFPGYDAKEEHAHDVLHVDKKAIILLHLISLGNYVSKKKILSLTSIFVAVKKSSIFENYFFRSEQRWFVLLKRNNFDKSQGCHKIFYFFLPSCWECQVWDKKCIKTLPRNYFHTFFVSILYPWKNCDSLTLTNNLNHSKND